MKGRHWVSGHSLLSSLSSYRKIPVLVCTLLFWVDWERIVLLRSAGEQTPCSEHSSYVGLQQEEASCLSTTMPFLKAGIVLTSHSISFGSLARSQWACGESLCACLMKREDGEKNKGKLAKQLIISAGLGVGFGSRSSSVTTALWRPQ